MLANFAKKLEDVEKYDIEGKYTFFFFFVIFAKYLLIFTVEFDRFLPANSPLLDVEVIVGSQQLLAFLVRRFDKHVLSDDFKSWDALLWIQSKWYYIQFYMVESLY